jgi:hypothetical protein
MFYNRDQCQQLKIYERVSSKIKISLSLLLCIGNERIINIYKNLLITCEGKNMTFNEIMALILPSLVAFLFYLKAVKRNVDLFEGFCTIGLFLLIINCICYSILALLRKM